MRLTFSVFDLWEEDNAMLFFVVFFIVSFESHTGSIVTLSRLSHIMAANKLSLADGRRRVRPTLAT